MPHLFLKLAINIFPIRSIRRNLRRKLLRDKGSQELIHKKWLDDSRDKKFTAGHEVPYKIIMQYRLRKTGNLPNLINPFSYNDKIAWLMLFDQNPMQVICSDKYKVRKFVEDRIGSKYLPNLYSTVKKTIDINFRKMPESFVIKANHDSGSVFIVERKKDADLNKIKKSLQTALDKKYGRDKGEWAYGFIDPYVIIEELLHDEKGNLPADFKFHCVDGKVVWLQYIFDRIKSPKEAIYDSSFNLLEMQMDENFEQANPNMEKPALWCEMIEISERLSRGFKYVRVDLYHLRDRIVFGELTFYPRGGAYKTRYNKEFGKMMRFDMNQTRPIYLGGV